MNISQNNYKVLLHKYSLKEVRKKKYSEPRMKIKGRWGFFSGWMDTFYEKDLEGETVKYIDTHKCQVCGKEKDYWWHDIDFQFIYSATRRHQWEIDWLEYLTKINK